MGRLGDWQINEDVISQSAIPPIYQCLSDRCINADSVLAPRNSQQSAPMQPFERMRGRFRVPAPCVHDPALAEVTLKNTRVCLAEPRDCLQHLLFECFRAGCLPRMEQLPYASRYDAICVQVVFLNIEGWIFSFEIAGAISADALSQNQVLRTSRRADGIRLHEAEPIDRRSEVCRREQRAGNRGTPQR